jgi:uncharacterized OsmC-like protein
MAMQDIAAAIQRAQAVYRRRPEAGLDEDSPATARWDGGLRVVSQHAKGTRIVSDMPAEFGGSGGAEVTPGWLFRAGLAACSASCIAMNAAAEGVELITLEVVARSRSDARGLLAMDDADGRPIDAGACDLRLQVRVAARNVAPERLRAVVERGLRCSTVYAALNGRVPMALQIEIGDIDSA